MKSPNPTAPTANKADKEQKQVNWTLLKADLEAVVLRINSVVKVGSESNLPTVTRVVSDIRNNIETMLRHYGVTAETATEEVQQ